MYQVGKFIIRKLKITVYYIPILWEPVFSLVQIFDITQISIHMFHLFCDKHKAVFSFSHYEFNSNRSASTADWLSTLSTS